MKTIRSDAEGAVVHLSLDELDLVRNALNEARLLLKSDYETRMGQSREDADVVLDEFVSLVRQVYALHTAKSRIPSV